MLSITLRSHGACDGGRSRYHLFDKQVCIRYTSQALVERVGSCPPRFRIMPLQILTGRPEGLDRP